MINRMKETIPHVAHASTLIQLIKDLVHEIKKTSGVGSTLSIVLACYFQIGTDVAISLVSKARHVRN